MRKTLTPLEGETPFEMAIKAVENADPEQAQMIEKAIQEGRLTIRDVLGFVKTKQAIQ